MAEVFYRVLYPRPAFIVGSGSVTESRVNFMTATWISPACDEPPMVIFSCWKGNYTYELIEKFGQFSIMVCNDVDLLWKLGTSSGRNIDKVSKFKIRFRRGEVLDVPILENCMGFLECKVANKVDLGEYSIYFGEVVNWSAKNFGKYGWEEFWKIPLQKGGKAFTFPSRKLVIP